jgi:uridine kinase
MIILIGIVGPTCSGKTTVSDNLVKKLGNQCSVLSQDNYYYGGMNDTNYDVPNAIDFTLLVRHILKLQSGESVNVPVYDFATHRRTEETKKFIPTKIIIVEGILLYCCKELLNLLDYKVFIKSNPFDRKTRRIDRDVVQRGRTKEEIIKRYERDVEPSNKIYVDKSEIYASHILIDNCDFTFHGMNDLLETLKEKM